MLLRQIEHLDECYRLESGALFITGLQALVRLLLTQSALDRRRGLGTAGFVSGYRGSPLAGLDKELARAQPFLEPARIHFEPGLNEDLAATSIWGSQQVNLFPGARHDGVFALWYGKGPGVDRSGDPFKHGNAAGASRYGGVLVAAGDDHNCRSSSLPQQSEYSFMDAMMPVLNPADVEELLELGLKGFALSRFSGCWVGFKVIQETADATQTLSLDPSRIDIVEPRIELPPGGLNIRWPDPPLAQEERLHRHKLPAALEFARVNHFNRVVIESERPRFGIVTTGKAHLDALQALEDLGIDPRRAGEIGITLFKVGMNWPLEPHGIRAFAEGLDEILVVEEKRGVVEDQLKEQLYNWQAAHRPLIVGKRDERGAPLLASSGELSPAAIARVLAGRIRKFHASADIDRRLRFLEQQQARAAASAHPERLPHFCSGCPHNTSTRVPEGSRAMAGIGCHYMAAWMDRDTETFTQMGGEGATWIGQAPFTDTPHVFQNLGDGTYAHSGILAIRAAMAAGVNITYKILFNDAVAMTGGQPVEGGLTVARVAQQLAAEGVDPIVVVSDEPRKFRGAEDLPPRVAVHHRRALDSLQRQLRERPGVSALIYDQACATELHRKRKRGLAPMPDRRVVINELVCEGCGDCNVQSNCLSVLPVETELGRKRRINQSSCNLDFSCLEGFCPSFVTVRGAPAKRAPRAASHALPELPEPSTPSPDGVYNVLIAGVGGTGVVTCSGLLGLAAHLEGRAVMQLDQTGLAQKFGAVLSHVRIGPDRGRMHGMRIPAGHVDLLLGADLLVAGSKEPLSMLSADRAAVIVNSHEEMPPSFIGDPDLSFPGRELLDTLRQASRLEAFSAVDATGLASALLGESIAANVFLLGYAFQSGRLPVSGPALYRALELFGVNVAQNKLAFDWGRHAAEHPEEAARLAAPGGAETVPERSLDDLIQRRAEFLVAYQDAAYAERFKGRIERLRAAEQRVRPGSKALARAAAEGYFKVLAYKDEYEVARLYTETTFLESLRQEFGAEARLRFHFSPPLFARKSPHTGRPRKYELGGWVLPVLRMLARLRRLRGTWLDVFALSRDRKLERRLLADYERTLERIIDGLDERRFEIALQLARLPERIRGYGPVKERAAEEARAVRDGLLETWDSAPRAAERSARRATAA